MYRRVPNRSAPAARLIKNKLRILQIGLATLIAAATIAFLVVPARVTSATETATSTPVEVKKPLQVTRETPTIKDMVLAAFPDAPIMVDIARCESRLRQFDASGNVLKNPHSSARGVFQVMASIHAKGAARMGMDIYTTEGNIAYARYLYDRNGTRDWNASKYCWGV